ncbi:MULTISPECIES: response regulator transcription factor [Sporolactobacillus]|uniref:Two-component system, OmpR family, response regulator CssR n=1 Tax=Sporolactobacillus nakayamae TaxID=269670 RepID=A0A1I2VPL2_9BACL|nr:response regulator transcription factor [Sporolactobacillus nakayamae]SFG91255.1 two-component system, OmpR family, response regulator CssR [Sporolactobacillus nakayamae]
MNETLFKINLVEDEESLASILKAYMENEGWTVSVFHTAEDALDYMHNGVHLWILDIMLPGMSGYDLIKRIKENHSEQPVIFISARDQDLDKILGLELGSDDYLAKPFLPKELVIRVKKLLHRVYGAGIHENRMVISKYQLDVVRRKVFDEESQLIELTTKEFDVLLYLVENVNVAKSRQDILTEVWGQDYVGSDRAVDDVVRRIRRKMGRLSLETVYGSGYRIVS